MSVITRVGPYDVLDRRPDGTSVLCLAKHPSGDRQVLVRLLPIEDAGVPARERLVGELEALALVQHRNLVQVLDVVDDESGVGLVTEVLEGTTLAEAAATHPLGVRAVLDIGAQVCAGLHFAHALGLSHGRLRADQVCITRDGTAKIVNVGLSLIDRLVTDPGRPGTDIDRASDDWRLADLRGVGAILYQGLTGREPSSPSSVRTTLLDRDRVSSLGDAPAAVVNELVRVIELLLDHKKDAGSSRPGAAALGRVLTAARLALEEPSIEGSPSATEQTATMLMEPTIEPAFGAPAIAARTPVQPVVPAPRPGRTVVTVPVVAPRLGPVELGTMLAPLPATTPPTAAPDRRTRDVAVWGSIGAIGLLAAGVVFWLLPGGAPRPSRGPGAGAGVPAAGTWTLSLDSDPQGASIALDGTVRPEVTPVDLIVPRSPYPTIELTLEGFRPARVPVSDTVRLNGRVRVRLEPMPSSASARKVPVVLNASFPFDIVAGGRVISPPASEHAIEVRAGDLVTVRSAAFYLERSFLVPAEGLSVTLPAVARVAFDTTGAEGCAIAIGNTVTGSVPGGEPLLVPLGAYQFSLRCRDGRPRIRTAQVVDVPLNRVTFPSAP